MIQSCLLEDVLSQSPFFAVVVVVAVAVVVAVEVVVDVEVGWMRWMWWMISKPNSTHLEF